MIQKKCYSHEWVSAWICVCGFAGSVCNSSSIHYNNIARRSSVFPSFFNHFPPATPLAASRIAHETIFRACLSHRHTSFHIFFSDQLAQFSCPPKRYDAQLARLSVYLRVCTVFNFTTISIIHIHSTVFTRYCRHSFSTFFCCGRIAIGLFKMPRHIDRTA